MDSSTNTPINLSELNGYLVLQVPMPGAEPENIHIRISSSGEITVSATSRGERAESAKWYTHEWKVGAYNRTVKLPHAIDSNAINASYNNGVLSVSMPNGSATLSREVDLKTLSSAYGEVTGHSGQAAGQSK